MFQRLQSGAKNEQLDAMCLVYDTLNLLLAQSAILKFISQLYSCCLLESKEIRPKCYSISLE